ncbi:hypothetical protein GWI33_007215 [Rhynchophorus ferrugineus]|uniref:DNA repair protein SWI5 homolog n=1 Tax=Rhynchophorus ferrugineus TaxID=354439 RepID=A0A834MGT8_RHYFE|nr:hypothetical protein GWI33_007215 [Rhynchophorus ferrugineus]
MDKRNKSSKRRTPNTKQSNKKNKSKENLNFSELKLLYQSLKKRSAELDKEIAQIESEGISVNLKPEMQALHDYNDIKDVTQVVLGYLADTEHTPISELYQRYNLPREDI